MEIVENEKKNKLNKQEQNIWDMAQKDLWLYTKQRLDEEIAAVEKRKEKAYRNHQYDCLSNYDGKLAGLRAADRILFKSYERDNLGWFPGST